MNIRSKVAHLILAVCTASFARTQIATFRPSGALLPDQFSASVEALTSRVSPSVVKIMANRYGPREESTGSRTGLIVGRQLNIGSGVIVDSDGYIMTNAHVVSNAQRIRVALVTKSKQSIASVLADSYAPLKDATVVGVFKEGDLASFTPLSKLS